ncbi:hypothetical protein [Methanobrevibacter sp.]|uniref:hypothetical protein n=1 Tax=Methanobrevibacter sp. TaxID=66852 RepID=UPI003869CA99
MNRKIILGLSLVLIAIMAIGSVSAFDLGSILSGDEDAAENETVTIDGIDFNIPAGFTEDPAHATDNQTNQQGGITYITNGKLYENNDTIVALLVADYGEYKVTDEIAQSVGGEAETINNVSGYLTTDGIYKVFNYAKDDKLVVISANDEDVIADFIIG